MCNQSIIATTSDLYCIYSLQTINSRSDSVSLKSMKLSIVRPSSHYFEQSLRIKYIHSRFSSEMDPDLVSL